jgi:hypothetical protein
VVGYGVRELVPINHDVSPAGTSKTAELTTPAAPSATPGGTATNPAGDSGRRPAGSAPFQSPHMPSPTVDPTPPDTSPSLRPDPSLPQITLPDLSHLLGPFFGTTSPALPRPTVTPNRTPIVPQHAATGATDASFDH